MKIKAEIIEGIFVAEKRNRFLCEILINNKVEECYIPSASKLGNYIKLENKKVLLTKNKGDKSRTKYSVFAVEYYGKFIVLNLAIVNKVLEEFISTDYNYESIMREKYIEDYKADFLVSGENNTIIEAKGIIANRKNVLFPTVHSQRAICQLKKIYLLLSKGFKAEYYFISLSPIVKHVYINKDLIHFEYMDMLKKCVDSGMELKGFTLNYIDGEVYIKDKLTIHL